MRRLLTFPLLITVVSNTAALAQNNILVNGGFENGLMCYAENIWGVDESNAFAGDYRFSLSNDVHSGTYSVKLSCPAGGDCNKAALYSQRIPATPNQAYQLSFYAKCPVGNTPWAHVPNTAAGDVGIFPTCDGTWRLNQLPFQMGPDSGVNFYFSIYSYGASSLLIDDILLTYGDGTAPAHTALHAGTRNVSISGQTVK